MSWTIVGMLAIATAWTMWRWRRACTANQALTRRLETSEFLLTHYRELEAERAMCRENDDYLRVTGGCNREHQCRDCGREQLEWYTEEDTWHAFEETKDEMFDVYDRHRTGCANSDEGRLGEGRTRRDQR